MTKSCWDEVSGDEKCQRTTATLRHNLHFNRYRSAPVDCSSESADTDSAGSIEVVLIKKRVQVNKAFQYADKQSRYGIHISFIIDNSIFHLSLEMLIKFWKISLKDA